MLAKLNASSTSSSRFAFSQQSSRARAFSRPNSHGGRREESAKREEEAWSSFSERGNCAVVLPNAAEEPFLQRYLRFSGYLLPSHPVFPNLKPQCGWQWG